MLPTGGLVSEHVIQTVRKKAEVYQHARTAVL